MKNYSEDPNRQYHIQTAKGESVTENGCIQLLPGVHKSDGFFIARLRKKEV